MTEIRVYPEKDLACIVTELGAVDSADNVLWSSVNYDSQENDGEYVYIRMKLSELMHKLEAVVKGESIKCDWCGAILTEDELELDEHDAPAYCPHCEHRAVPADEETLKDEEHS